MLTSLISATCSALKQTLLDLATQYGNIHEGSRSDPKNSISFQLKYLRSRPHQNDEQPWESDRQRRIPFTGAGAGIAIISRSKQDTLRNVDDDSQDGILRRDDFEISCISNEHAREAVRRTSMIRRLKAITSFSQGWVQMK